MTTFNDPPDTATRMLQQVLNEYEDHKPLVEAGVTIALRFAVAAEKKDGTVDFPLKLHGHRAYAIARIRKYADRTEGLSDAKIDVDAGWWMEAEDDERKALLDHECLHFEVQYSDDGAVETDDFNRPKLKMRKHDFEFGWFKTIAKRHGSASIECQQMQRMVEEAGQYLLPGILATAAALPPTRHESGTVTISSGGESTTMRGVDFSRDAKTLALAAGANGGVE